MRKGSGKRGEWKIAKIEENLNADERLKKKKKNRDQTTKYYRRKKCKGRRCARVKSRCKKLPLSFDVAKSSDWSFHNIFDFTIVRDGSAYIRYIRKLSELLYLNYIYIYKKRSFLIPSNDSMWTGSRACRVTPLSIE